MNIATGLMEAVDHESVIHGRPPCTVKISKAWWIVKVAKNMMQNIDGLMDMWTTGKCSANARWKLGCKHTNGSGGPCTRLEGEFWKVYHGLNVTPCL